jgi:dihydroorotase-like cyclic amidohydrolase
VVDMPLNSIPSTTTTSNLKAKTDRATGACHVDIAFWGGVVPDNAEDLVPLVNAGVKGFKCFLCNSGVDEFRHVEEADLHKALPKIQHSGRKMLFHAELGDRDEESTHNHRNYSTFLKTSPESMEESAIALVARLTEQYTYSPPFGILCTPYHSRSSSREETTNVCRNLHTLPHLGSGDSTRGSDRLQVLPTYSRTRKQRRLMASINRW